MQPQEHLLLVASMGGGLEWQGDKDCRRASHCPHAASRKPGNYELEETAMTDTQTIRRVGAAVIPRPSSARSGKEQKKTYGPQTEHRRQRQVVLPSHLQRGTGML